jgi:hypothetical protein
VVKKSKDKGQDTLVGGRRDEGRVHLDGLDSLSAGRPVGFGALMLFCLC